MTRFRAVTFAVLLGIVSVAALATAQPDLAQPDPQAAADASGRREAPPPDRGAQLEQLRYAIERLPIAAGLAVLLALRPRRRGTPKRQAQVVQTQIILAIVGAVVMLVVGTSLARAFGIVGAAGLVRYRAKIDDPKDAGVMLSTLAIGLASGVGLWMLAAFSTAFVLAVLWLVESFEPQARQLFTLSVKANDAVAFRPKLESLLSRYRLQFELRSSSADLLTYEVRLPLDRKVDRLSNGILKLAPENVTGVEWEEKKEKK
ncbi:MAG TPA: DUF4956 domain-containing protein [Vicinamibacterales bacterium]|nr:DUF4956 domain-containing protein [Vicinamibacterales bacterium]